MSISIIGAGNVGVAPGQAFAQRGETVVYGVPEPARYEGAVAALGDKARVTTTAEAIAASDTVILAVPHAALLAIAQSRRREPGRQPLPAGRADDVCGDNAQAR